MSERRKDNRGRLLHNGEIQLPDGRYKFKYVDVDGQEKAVYSWRLDRNDCTPSGKKVTESLREKEKAIQTDLFNRVSTSAGNMTVIELVEKYINTKNGVKVTTKAGYGTVINFLKKRSVWEQED